LVGNFLGAFHLSRHPWGLHQKNPILETGGSEESF
jgi:hypothetical protein